MWRAGTGCGWLVVAGIVTAAHGQDQRRVAEPAIPAVCVRLEAQLMAPPTGLNAKDERKPDTARIAAAIDRFAGDTPAAACKAGTAVELAPGVAGANAFLTGPLELKAGVTLLVDQGVTLYASRRASDYDITPGSCGVMQREKLRGCKPILSIHAKNVGIMGDGIIDGRGGSKLLDKSYSWWGLAVKAEPGNMPYSDPRLIDAVAADGLVLYRITLHNSPNFHVGVAQTDGFTAWGVHLKTPTAEYPTSAPRPRNTDGIDPGSSKNITIAHSWIDNGDDNIAIKTGVMFISVLDNHFYSGHGMSVGSETYSGVSYLFLDGLTEDHTTSGIRIKSNATRGGLVHDMIYRNVCMTGVPIPIAISPYYNNGTTDPFVDPGIKGDHIPEYRRITIVHARSDMPGEVLIAGYDATHRSQVDLVDLAIKDATIDRMHFQFADLGDGGTNLPLEKAAEGRETTVQPTRTIVARSNFNCVGKFPPMQ